MRIGHTRSAYPEVRTILGACPGATYIRQRDATTQVMGAVALAQRLGWTPGPRWSLLTLGNQCRPFGRRFDVLHLFNQVSFGRGPWVSTFESMIPRYAQTLVPIEWEAAGRNPDVLHALGAIASSACRGIVALSRCTARLQEAFLQHAPPSLAEAVTHKMHILHPPQPVLVTAAARMDGPLKLMFVGNLFHRKGGRELLAVCEKLREEGHDLQLTIVSALTPDPFPCGDTESAMASTRARITAHRGWIIHHEHLPNAQVLALMKEAHVGLLPTYADTYGYAVLEFQASGCPVVTTNVRALPEINSDTVGWLIEVPRNARGEAEYGTPEALRELSLRITEGLEITLRHILANPCVIPVKGERALARVRSDHDPKRYAERLLEIYRGDSRP